MDWNPTTNSDASAMQYWLNAMAIACHRTAKEHGWWENWERNIPEQLALMHSELSEALEEIRKHPDPRHVYYTSGDLTTPYEGHMLVDGQENPIKPEGFGVELVDCLIRILDTCERYDIDVGAIFLDKMRYNESRPYRHGGKHA